MDTSTGAWYSLFRERKVLIWCAFFDAYGYISSSGGSYNYRLVIMSKSGTPELGAIEEISTDDNTEAVEVARYNLQGIPVNENEKGVQIIVYSNYTTKTVVVQWLWNKRLKVVNCFQICIFAPDIATYSQ